ncbi:MAG: dienelactone hydrolase family protein [Kofleriaceae bacterium]|nr:dienelactone hydrolase family protein [Myxococcales bacterium]MCB9562891.1 dienelactone hydrolase family protein [Kofleriaceae bacterium]MCB9572732.1 dienelactone hydrolase family protein [Kofleriaceae bacterium]
MIELYSAHDGFTFGAHQVAARGARRGSVVVIQEIFGVTEHIRERCDVFAGAGYDVLAPSLFDRIERGFLVPFDVHGVQRGRDAVEASPWPQVMSDVQTTIDALTPPVSIVGFCYGGAVAWLAAARCTGLVGASAFYGRLINSLLDDAPQVPIILHYGARDPGIPPAAVDEVRARYPDLPVHLYEAGHGFCRQGSSDHDAASCALATDRTLALFASLV